MIITQNKLTKGEKSWILYDVANSAFTMLISTTIPIYFAQLVEQAGYSPASATALWGGVTAAAVLILAVLSPILGAVADYQGMKKKMFAAFLIMGLVGAVMLATVGSWMAFLAVFVVARVGYSACNVFYDSMLTDVTTDERMDQLSSLGYAWGYIGSCIPFIIGIAILFTGNFSANAFRLSFLITALWWLVLTIPLLRNVTQRYGLADRRDKVTHAFHRLGITFGKIRKDKKLLFFILGYFCYIDGVYTIISMATTYGNEVGIDSVQMILALLLTQFVAFPCAIGSGMLAKRFGSLKVVKVFIWMYMGICLFGYQLDKAWEFWVLAVLVGICQGGIQALSRSYFGQIIPKEESNEYFGFFDIFGKFADFLGPLIISICATLFGTSNYGILALVVLFLAGWILLRRSEKA
ncbi:MAG: MFS transporter [Angelakisella sp.]|nr:MFS transporter [Angelakisella sp.]